MSGVVRLPARDRALQLKRQLATSGHRGNRFSAPLSPKPVPRASPERALCLEPLTSTEKLTEADHVTLKLRRGILKSHTSDGTELLFFTHQLRALQLIERDETTVFLLSYATGAGKTIIAAAIIACCFITLKQMGGSSEMKIAVVVPKTLRAQWKTVLLRWLTLDEKDILEVQSGADMTHEKIKHAKIVLVTRTLLSHQYEQAFAETEGGEWVRKEGTELPPVYQFHFHRLIIDEIHTIKNNASSWCFSHAELSKRCDKRIGMSATLVQSSMADLAGECKALGMPERFCNENAWTRGERGVVDFDTLEEFRKKYQDVLQRHMLGLPEPRFQVIYFVPQLTPAQVKLYNGCIRIGKNLRISDELESAEKKKKLTKLSAAVRCMQHLPVSPQLVRQSVEELHKDPKKVAAVAECDGGALAAFLRLLGHIREREDGGRVIVTAAMTIHLKVLRAYLAAHAPSESVLYFDGATVDRSGMINQFLADDNPRCILLLSLQAGGQGLDIVVQPDRSRTIVNYGCSSIVFFGARQYTASWEDQAVGRINRLNQTRLVHVYHLLVRGGVDEAIGRVQDEKGQLSSAVAGDFSNFSSSSGLHTWRKSGGVLRDCYPLTERGVPILPTENQVRVRKATDALAQRKIARHGKARAAPEASSVPNFTAAAVAVGPSHDGDVAKV